MDWINELPTTAVVLDYGCGKFRYAIPLARRVQKVYCVDCKNQIERLQLVNEKRTSLKEYARTEVQNIVVVDANLALWRRRKYDRILLANVLSTIPSRKTRAIVLERLYKVLRQQGELLACTQFRNSYFNTFQSNPEARPYLDGWLVANRKRPSFYGIINPQQLANICRKAGFTIIESYAKGDSAYVRATAASRE